jgi:hypothetical protein
MNPSDKKVLQEALRLPVEARSALAGGLLESLDGPVDEDAEAAWGNETERRIAMLRRLAQ